MITTACCRNDYNGMLYEERGRHIWTIRTDGSALTKIHTRTMNMEIAGHEFFSADGKVTQTTVRSLLGENCVLLYRGKTLRFKTRKGGSYQFESSRFLAQ